MTLLHTTLVASWNLGRVGRFTTWDVLEKTLRVDVICTQTQRCLHTVWGKQLSWGTDAAHTAETCLEPAVPLWVSCAQALSVLAVKGYTSAKCPSFWSGLMPDMSLPNVSFLQRHQGSPTIFCAHSVIAEAGETEPAYFSASLEPNCPSCPDLTFVPNVQNLGKVQDSPYLRHVHLRNAICAQLVLSGCAADTSGMVVTVCKVLIKNVRKTVEDQRWELSVRKKWKFDLQTWGDWFFWMKREWWYPTWQQWWNVLFIFIRTVRMLNSNYIFLNQ